MGFPFCRPGWGDPVIDEAQAASQRPTDGCGTEFRRGGLLGTEGGQDDGYPLEISGTNSRTPPVLRARVARYGSRGRSGYLEQVTRLVGLGHRGRRQGAALRRKLA